MIHDSPKALPRRRLEQLIHGLQIRTNSSASQLAAELQRLYDQRDKIEKDFLLQLQSIENSSSAQRDQWITQWDESAASCWDDAEQRTFKAVFETRNREKSITNSAKQDGQQVKADAIARAADIERRFARSFELTGEKLDQYRQQIETVRRVVEKVRQDGELALAKHSLAVPTTRHVLEMRSCADSSSALELAKLAIVSAGEHAKRLENLPLANLSRSPIWWVVCLVLALIVLVVTLTIHPNLLIAVSISAGSIILSNMIAMLGVRPWLNKAVAAEYPKLLAQIDLSERFLKLGNDLSIAECDTEQKKLAQHRDDRLASITQWHDTQIIEIRRKAEAKLMQLRNQAQEQKQMAAQQLTTGLAETASRYQLQLDNESQTVEQQRSLLSASNSANLQQVVERIERLKQSGASRIQGSTNKAAHLMDRNNRWCQRIFPAWNELAKPNSAWPCFNDQPNFSVGQMSAANFVPATTASLDSIAQLDTHVHFSPLDDGYLVIRARPTSAMAKELVRTLIIRALTALPPGRTQLCIVDPPGLGADFGWLMQLSDFDPSMVSHRVWTQTSHINRQVQNLAAAAEEFIQQSLRNQYASIVQFNRDAGSLAEPYRLLIWSSFPAGLDDTSWRGLLSLLDSGARCGIIPILLIDPSLPFAREYEEQLDRRGLHLSATEQGQWLIRSHCIQGLMVHPEPSATDAQADAIVAEVGRRALAASRVEVPLTDIIHSTVANCWQGDSSRLLEIPIGQSGVGRVHNMRLGVGTAQHAIIAGKTGSGKSSLLHALITSALLKYSPASLRLVLLDFKKGVEFQVYSDACVPHADIIGIESHREFGLSTLQFIDECMQRRGELYRQVGVQDIASWNAARPQTPLPRILLVIDEFQELFVEDDRLSQAASLILDRIVRQGRSFGVHAVLSSQTLAGSYSLPRTTLGQMAVRIALQCDAADAQIIFAEDNPAASRLKHPGQAIYNDAGGRIEGNQPVQVGWLDKATQLNWFSQLKQGYQNPDVSTNLLGRTVIFDGNRPAIWQADHVQLAVDRARQELNRDALWCVVGESVAISPAVLFPITNQSGRNMLIVGGDDAQASAVMHAISQSFVQAVDDRGQRAMLIALQGAKPTETHAQTLPKLWSKLPCDLTSFDLRNDQQAIAQVYQMLQSRIENPQVSAPPVLVSLIQIGRLRNLRRDDEFNFSQSETTPDKMLEQIMREGPSHSIHLMIWAESYSIVNRWLARTALREFEIRLLMQMSSNDSSNLIDSVSASRLGEHVMLLYDEATGQEQKYRPYSMDSLQANSK